MWFHLISISFTMDNINVLQWMKIGLNFCMRIYLITKGSLTIETNQYSKVLAKEKMVWSMHFSWNKFNWKQHNRSSENFDWQRVCKLRESYNVWDKNYQQDQSSHKYRQSFAVTQNTPRPMIILEFCSNGSIHSFVHNLDFKRPIRKNSGYCAMPAALSSKRERDESLDIVKSSDLLSWSYQCSRGM